jgi:glycosyltransferase involved in cell wall biosynthesis
MMTLFYVFSACVAIQTLFAVWMLWASGNPDKQAAPLNDNLPPVSIIICARNEAATLRQHLPLFLAQDHPAFEVIVVNDASVDETSAILSEMQQQYPCLKVITIASTEDRVFPGKKFPLSRGIAAARFDHVLLTDADCFPASAQWASRMAAGFDGGKKELVAGYGAYTPHNSVLNTFVRWETMHTFLQYSSYNRLGIPYMAVGRNLAAKKELVLKAQDNPLWTLTASGDDDLLIRLTGSRGNMAIQTEPHAFTYSKAKETWSDWMAQKQRHLSTGKLYRRGVQFVLGVYGMSHGLMWLLFFILWLNGFLYLILSMMLLRCLLLWCLWGITALSLKEKRLILWLPFCDLGWAFYNFILSPYIFFKSKKQWT